MSRRSWRVVEAMAALALVVAMMAFGTRAQGAEAEPVPVAELPESVVEAAKKLCPGGQITGAKKETDLDKDGQVVEYDYVLEVTLEGGKFHTVEIDTTPDVKVKPGECEAKGPVAAADLPAAVADALKRLCPEGQLASGERSARLSKDKAEAEYTLKVTLAGDKAAEVSIRVSGEDQIRETRLRAPIPVAEVPEAIGEVLKLMCPGGSVAEAEKRTRTEGEKVRNEYELKLKTLDGKAFKASVQMGDEGRIRRIEVNED